MPAMPTAAPHAHAHLAGTPPHHHEAEPSPDHAALSAPHHAHPAPHSHKSPSKDNCCQDDAAAVWATLAHPPRTDVAKLLSAFTPLAAPYALPARFQRWDRTRPVALVARRQLKPKIPDIRIFIQSLIV
ncbi:hypothetical protein A0257_21100 [Hymenobacter psoromatis]|nr:hypothetical protein A0257_21100 [Hymenobacter psoromatis]